jgi:sec-independent protein translocase protein TatB
MMDFGFDKIALIGAVALVVIGPEKLPRVARTVGALFGKAQRYVSDVKAEVNRSIELEELKKMKTQFEDAARNVEDTVRTEVNSASAAFESDWASATSTTSSTSIGTSSRDTEELTLPPPSYERPKKNWRLKRGATPQWYKQRAGIRTRALSGAARVARFRPPGVTSGRQP